MDAAVQFLSEARPELLRAGFVRVGFTDRPHGLLMLSKPVESVLAHVSTFMADVPEFLQDEHDKHIAKYDRYGTLEFAVEVFGDDDDEPVVKDPSFIVVQVDDAGMLTAWVASAKTRIGPVPLHEELAVIVLRSMGALVQPDIITAEGEIRKEEVPCLQQAI